MQRGLLIAAAVVLILHGVIHLMGTAAYLKLGKSAALPYKTTLLGGMWHVGDPGIRIFGVLWLVPALGFVVAGVALLAGAAWWPPLVTGMAWVSLALTVLDWRVAYAGIMVNVLILCGLWVAPAISRWLSR